MSSEGKCLGRGSPTRGRSTKAAIRKEVCME